MLSKKPDTNLKRLVTSIATALSFCMGTGVYGQSEKSSEKDIFVAKPYLQMGTSAQASNHDSQEILWLAKDKKSSWSVEVSQIKDNKGNKAVKAKTTTGPIAVREIGASKDSPDYSFSCKIDNLPFDSIYKYRVLKDSKPVFEAEAHTRKSFDSPLNFVLFGDLAAKTDGQKKIAYQCYLAKPDFVVLPGDIVYNRGLYSEYLDKFFPVYNTDSASANSGVPLIRSILTIGVLGNHDIAYDPRIPYTDFKSNPDALAYYFLWSQPLNGPTKTETNSATPIGGDAERESFFKKAAGDRYPAMGNFSFNYGNTHWLVLDGNYYSNWADPKMRKFVIDDLEKAKTSTWRFVTFHQPPFSIDKHHADEQHMRLLADIFEKEKVDIVFAGHAHDYQRTYPLTFVAKGASTNNGVGVVNPNGTVEGEISFDKTFDGKTNTHPHAPIYIVSGGGGAALYPIKDLPAESVKYMDKVYAAKHSLTKCVINDKKLVFQQISEDGAELDKFEIDK
ncbi:MAG: metallophosphoesterase [Candidatus Obscuribacterales bacterium]|nr:metallophosphoesterase [Candidatus Obscuribacterales bacterium]